MGTRRALAIGGFAAAGAAVAAACASVALGGVLARVSGEIDRGVERPVRVKRVFSDGGQYVWLAGEGASAAGSHSLLFDAPGAVPGGGVGAEPTGHAKLGPVIARDGRDVLREVVAVDSGELVAGAAGRMVGWWYTSPQDLGFRVEEIRYETELGPMDAWIVYPKRARGRRWAIHTHGRGASPAETFRGIEPFARAGITSLIIHYRNDRGQPAGNNGRYGMGISESRDVDAAIAEARSRGAERVTLMGWSMGGTASVVAASRGVHRNVIDGLVLDSPGADWPALLRSQAVSHRLPRWIADVGMWLLSRDLVKSGEPGGIDFSELTPAGLGDSIERPVLILASPDDRFVSWEGSLVIAERRPDFVQLVSIPTGGHVRLWNADPVAWEQAVLSFVRALPKPGWRGQ